MKKLAKQNIIDPSTSMLQVIERAAMSPDVDIDKMERLLQMKERIDAKAAEQEYAAAMSRVQSKIPMIQRKSSNAQTNSMYAKLEAINLVITPIYTAEGFSLSFGEDASQHEGEIRTVCDVNHIGGHSKRYYYDLPMDNVGIKGTVNKTGVHAKGSSTSYARRYLTMMIFNLAIGDDNDGNKPSATITEEQAETILALITETNANKEKFCQYYKIESVENLPAAKFQHAVKSLEARRK